jgi:SpoVK/Ycf46/Vps4 family AAA+-type ATPase
LLSYPHTIVIASEATWQAGQRNVTRPIFPITFPTPNYERRLAIWQTHLETAVDLDLRPLANHFRFTPGQIAAAAATAHDLAQWRGETMTTADLFTASRLHSNQKLATLATKITPRYTWDEIVLPDDTLAQLREMVNVVQQRPIVYGQWGFGQKQSLGKGLNALFAGESGTGKTMSADIMANELSLDLYKIDLSSLVSKYIGETEKNLDRIFTEAATSNAILFFDEADAIFGKRSEVKDSHDRYANIEISYLLQRMEAYDGVVILATNLRANMDDAFTRRLHFAVEFPFPEAADRERIWQVNVPSPTPLADDVDFKQLAQRFRLAGGSIRNIILAAAFLAASDQAISMKHFLHATRREYQKMGRLIDERLFENE